MLTAKKILKFSIYSIFAIACVWTLLLLNIYRHSIMDETQKADTIVVLGASQWNGKPSPTLKSRLDHAISLYTNNYATYVILTGGIAEGAKMSESRAGRNYLLENGVPEEQILIEEEGLTSLQSLREVSDILKRHKLKKIILVSHGFHMMRLKKIARDLYIEEVFASPVNTPDKINELKYSFRESVIYAAYLSSVYFHI